MSPKKDPKLAYWIAVVLMFVAVVCYAVPEKQPEKPVRQMFKCIAGKVLFTHQEHFSTTAKGYGITCKECHHHNEEENKIKECGDCHDRKLSKTVPKICLDCHEPDENHHLSEEEVEYSCNECHTPAGDEEVPQACLSCHDEGDVEGMEKTMNMQARTDAFHNQCIECHKAYEEKAPIECSACHVQ